MRPPLASAVGDGPPASNITVLGVGNPIMADDGVGLALLERVRALRGDCDVEFVDGATGGMELLPVVQDCDRLLVLDAVAGPVPGVVEHLTGDQLPRLLSSKLSPHQVGLLDVLTAARLLGREPSVIEVVGVVPRDVELSLGLTPAVEAAVPDAVQVACEVLDGWLAIL